MRYYPINLDLDGQPVLVIGGGEVATRKVEGLLEAGAKIRVIAPRVLPLLKKLAEKKRIRLILRDYQKGDLDGIYLAVAATDDTERNKLVHAEAKKAKILLNVVDRPELCNFVFPARINRGEFMVTVSTGGASPALAKKVREDLEGFFGPEYGALVSILEKLRKKFPPAKTSGADKLFTALVRSPILQHLRQGDRGTVDRLLKSLFGEKVSISSLGCKLEPRSSS